MLAILRELYDEPITDDEFAELVAKPVQDLGIIEMRRMMIRLNQIDRERSGVQEILDAVTASYREKLARYERDAASIRDRLYQFVKAKGTVSFPDVGTAYLSPLKAKVDVVNATLAREWAKGKGYVKQEADVTKAKAAMFKSGEIPPPESGMEWVPERETLVVRKP